MWRGACATRGALRHCGGGDERDVEPLLALEAIDREQHRRIATTRIVDGTAHRIAHTVHIGGQVVALEIDARIEHTQTRGIDRTKLGEP
jgi:hypothetical protein